MTYSATFATNALDYFCSSKSPNAVLSEIFASLVVCEIVTDDLNNSRASSDEDDCEEEAEDAHEADYEDDDSESEASDVEAGNVVARIPATAAARRRPKRRKSEDETSTEVDSDDDTTSTDDSDDDSSSSSSESSDFSSGTNTECEFTDSEGKPNPFHKELEVPKIVIEPGSPVAPRHQARAEQVRIYPARKYVQQKVELESKELSEPNLASLTYASRLQYKTPNLSSRLQSEDVKQAGYVTRSTQRALSLKKNWVSDNPTTVTTGKKSDAVEMDNRLKR